MFENCADKLSPGARPTFENDQCFFQQEQPGEVYLANIKAIFRQNALKLKFVFKNINGANNYKERA